MSQRVIEIAIAGFLHDIGKFVQRISNDSGVRLPSDFPIAEFQPKSKNGQGLSYSHASYTAFFIKNQLKAIPEISNIEDLVNLAAKHHLSTNTNEEYVISVADKLSAGMDRKNFDAENAKEINYSQYRKTRLMSIFDELNRDIPDYEHRNFQYDLAPLTSESIFPIERDDISADYTTLASGFIKDLEQIKATTLKDWFLQFDAVAKKWTSFIPAATVERVIPDVSLYDHAKTTSAFAQALYVYHTEQEKKLIKAHISDNVAEKKFLYFKAKFNGIQNFIFSVGSQTNKKAAKILRGRSFYISLLMRKYALGLCDYLGLAHTAIIMNAAGNITALLPNTPKTINKLKEFQKIVNEWLIKQFYGEVSISCAYEEITGECLIDSLVQLGERIAKKLDIAKFKKLPLDSLGVVQNYFNLGDHPCVFCGRRPAHGTEDSCLVCEDLIKIGQILSRQDKKTYVLKNKIFDCFDTVEPKDYDFLYVPHWDSGETKSFEDISDKEALGVLKADIDNLGSLFNKVSSGMGLSGEGIYSKGLARQVSFSRMLDAFWTIWLPAELKNNSKFNNIYTVFAGGDDLFLIGKWNSIIDFAFYLREQFEKYTCNNPGITLSAGIAVLKPGEVISKFYDLSENALELSKEYADEQGNIKNALTLFGETIPWSRRYELDECYKDIETLIEENKINSGALSKLMQFIDMATTSDNIKQELVENGTLSYKYMQNFKWKALLTYFIAHNEKIKNTVDKQKRIESFVRQIEDAGKRSILKVMLWKNIYENRRRD